MRRKILTIIYIILVLTILKLSYNIILIKNFINKYNNQEFDNDYAKNITYLTFTQKYVSHYNYGNVLYQNGEYEKAMQEYEKALKGRVPRYKECSIRINYALSICKTVKVDETSSDSIANAIETYESAIDVLTEEGCANKNDDQGHSEQAEQLKKDIQKEIDRLKNLEKSPQPKQKTEEQPKPKEEEEKVETQIQKIKEDANKEQKEIEQRYDIYNKEFDPSKEEKNW